ncbi:hypothetical protein N0B51_01870 [Tsuneonella sp. YG55]|uniref:Lipoprotein n=1 Tax=Tsuneonella litorea TaxID=2976475 RepID=A0A9X2VYY7_9SPHN|nr:hypothetical protein [Tsuneonella litorea]MCT2557721.1 hypothetical protein [Tsuneonella litorea]
MRLLFFLSATLVCGACAASPDYVVRYDLAQLAFETSERDASPGFASLPESAPKDAEAPAA